MNNLKQHALSAAFPAMTQDELLILTADIEAHGQHEPCVIFEDRVLDGWHRYSACIKIGIAALVVQLPDTLDPVDYVRSRNMHRRHLTGSQRAAAEVACNEWAESGQNQHSKQGGGEPGARPQAAQAWKAPATNKEMAKSAGVSERTIKDAKAAQKAGLGQDVVDGKITAKAAANQGKPAKEEPEPEYSKLDQLTDENSELKEAIETLQVSIATATYSGSESSLDEIVANLRAENKILTINYKAMVISRDGYMREVEQLKIQCKIQKKQLDKK